MSLLLKVGLYIVFCHHLPINFPQIFTSQHEQNNIRISELTQCPRSLLNFSLRGLFSIIKENPFPVKFQY